jgi:hypothetical protein
MPDRLHNTPPYIYQPLVNGAHQVRLIHVRRNSQGTIECDFDTFPIQHLPGYQALSYAWDSPTPIYNILIDKERFDVGGNLYHFLEESKSNVLWPTYGSTKSV